MTPSLVARLENLSDAHAIATRALGEPGVAVTVTFGAGGVCVQLFGDVELVRALLTDALAQLDALGTIVG